MFGIGITEQMIADKNIKIKGFFRGDEINWIVEVKDE